MEQLFEWSIVGLVFFCAVYFGLRMKAAHLTWRTQVVDLNDRDLLVFRAGVGPWIRVAVSLSMPLLYCGLTYFMYMAAVTDPQNTKDERIGYVVIGLLSVLMVIGTMTVIYVRRAMQFIRNLPEVRIDESHIRIFERGVESKAVALNDIDEILPIQLGQDIKVRLRDGLVSEIPALQPFEVLLTPILRRMPLRENEAALPASRGSGATWRWILVVSAMCIFFAGVIFWASRGTEAPEKLQFWTSHRYVLWFNLALSLFGVILLVGALVRSKLRPFVIERTAVKLRNGQSATAEEIKYLALGQGALSILLMTKDGRTLEIHEQPTVTVFRALLTMSKAG